MEGLFVHLYNLPQIPPVTRSASWQQLLVYHPLLPAIATASLLCSMKLVGRRIKCKKRGKEEK